jgi:hypothetical protein
MNTALLALILLILVVDWVEHSIWLREFRVWVTRARRKRRGRT